MPVGNQAWRLESLDSRLLIRYVQWAKITHTNNARYSWMDYEVPTSIRGQLPSVELRSEPFSNATHCLRAPLGRTEVGLQRLAGAKHGAKSSLARTLLSLTVFYCCSTALIWALDPG